MKYRKSRIPRAWSAEELLHPTENSITARVRRILGQVYRRNGFWKGSLQVNNINGNDLADLVEALMALYLCYQISYENCVADDLRFHVGPVESSLILSTSAETPNILVAQRPILWNSKAQNDITKVLALRLGKAPGPAPRIVAVDKYVARWPSRAWGWSFRVLKALVVLFTVQPL